jgi:hypothetical protein
MTLRHPPDAPRRPHPTRGAAPCVLLMLAGCAQASPALQVGDIGFAEEEVRGLGSEQLELLAAVAVVGEATATGTGARAGALVLEQDARRRLEDRLREEVILEAAGVSDEALRARYELAPEYELEVRHLVLLAEGWASAADRRRAREGAEAALRRIQAGEPFDEVAAQVSEEPGAAARGGLLRPGRRGTWVEPFWAAASVLPEGGLSPVVETPFGYHVLRLERRTPLPFREARPGVVREVAATLGGAEAWEDLRRTWIDQVTIVPPDEAPRPRFAGVLELAALGPAAAPDPDQALATWPDGALRAGEFARRLLVRPTPELRRMATDPAALEAALRTEAELERLVSMARERGLDPSEEDLAADLRGWETRMLEWGVFLGFRAGMSPGEVSTASLAALRTTGQNARIARDGIAQAAPALLGTRPLSGSLAQPRER